MAEIPCKGEIGEEQRRREVESHLRDKSASGKKGWRRIFDDSGKHCDSIIVTYNAIISMLLHRIYDRIPLLLKHTHGGKKTKGCVSKC